MVSTDAAKKGVRSRSWQFSLPVEIQDFQDCQVKLAGMRYVAHYKEDAGIRGFIFSDALCSERMLERIVPHATWLLVHGLKNNADFQRTKASGQLTQIGVLPSQGARIDPDAPHSKKRKVTEPIVDVSAELAEARTLISELQGQLETAKKNQLDLKHALDASKASHKVVQADYKRLEEQMGTNAHNTMTLFTTYFKRDLESYTRNLPFVLRNLYDLHPPLRAGAKFVKPATSVQLTHALKQALLHYHPDKQGATPGWHKIMCTEITKFLNMVRGEVERTSIITWM
jgi:hypothetical protein